MTKKNTSRLSAAQRISRLQQRSPARNNPMVLIDRTFRCHQSAKITWPIGGACGPPIRDIHSPKGRSQAGGSTDQPPHRPSTNKHKSPARTKPSGAVSLGGGAQTPRKTVRWCFESSARVGHNARMAHAANFKLALTRRIAPTGGPGVELATLEDAARFVGLLRTWRQARPH